MSKKTGALIELLALIALLVSAGLLLVPLLPTTMGEALNEEPLPTTLLRGGFVEVKEGLVLNLEYVQIIRIENKGLLNSSWTISFYVEGQPWSSREFTSRQEAVQAVRRMFNKMK